MNILIKLTSIVALIIAPHISEGEGQGSAHIKGEDVKVTKEITYEDGKKIEKTVTVTINK
jgi:K(+)-stimulated pyrophosphate-energized sodium pump